MSLMHTCKVALVAAALCAWAAASQAADIIVSAAASLTNAFNEIGKQFEKNNASHKVIFNFGSSGALLQQISRGAPVDVFASADQDTMDRAAQQNLIVPTSRRDFTANTLVLVAPIHAGVPITRMEDLRDAGVKRIAISNPDTVPVGKYAKAALERAGLYGQLQAKFILTQNVRQSLDYVARGEVDAGFVYATDAAIMPARVSVLLAIPTPIAITYPIAAVKGGGRETLALRFVQFVGSETAQRILQRYGFKAVGK